LENYSVPFDKKLAKLHTHCQIESFWNNLLVNIQIKAIISNNMKVNNSYYLKIKIKSTKFTSNIKDYRLP